MTKPTPIHVGDRFILGDGSIWKVASNAFGCVFLFCEDKPAFMQMQTSVLRQRERASDHAKAVA